MKLKSLIALAALLAFGQGAWADGTKSFLETENEKGTEEKPFLIESIADLNALASDVNSGTDYRNMYFKLTADLDYSGVSLFDTDGDGKADSNFKPIGMPGDKDDIPFKGIFDGYNHTISGITVNKPSDIYIGLFGCIKYATIKNIKLSGCKFTGNLQVGGIVGYGEGSNTNHALIENCSVDETVEIKAVAFQYHDVEDNQNKTLPGSEVGGIIGCCDQGLTVKDCISKAKLEGDEAIGGIAGVITGTNSSHSILTDCFYSGDVSNIVSTGTKGIVVGERRKDENNNVTTDINLTLFDDDSEATVKNATRLDNYNGIENVNVTLRGRTLYKDDSWNTLCLPFDVTVSGSALDGATVKTLSSATFDDGTLTLTFEEATTIEAGNPYIIKWDSGDELTPTFEGVTVNSAAPTDVTGTAANFHGIYTPYSTNGENKSMFYLGANNKLYYPNANITIGAFRAYFTLNDGITAGPLPTSTPTSTPTQVRTFVLNFGDGGENTSIHESQSIDHNDRAGTWNDLHGRRLSGKPTASGIYINNGKKVAIK